METRCHLLGGNEFLNVIHMILRLKGLKILKKFENVRSHLSNYLQNRKVQAYRKRTGPTSSFFPTNFVRSIPVCDII